MILVEHQGGKLDRRELRVGGGTGEDETSCPQFCYQNKRREMGWKLPFLEVSKERADD